MTFKRTANKQSILAENLTFAGQVPPLLVLCFLRLDGFHWFHPVLSASNVAKDSLQLQENKRVSSLTTRNKETKEEQLPALILVIFKKESHEVRMSDISYFAIQPQQMRKWPVSRPFICYNHIIKEVFLNQIVQLAILASCC